MPEGPSIIIAKEAAQQFEGQTVLDASGNTKIDIAPIRSRKLLSLKSWGKHFLLCFDTFTIRIHFLMFGTYRINERKDSQARLSLVFPNGELNLYTCSIKILEGDVNKHYDFSGDVMNDNWNPRKARKKLKLVPDALVCDALLDQDIFAGVGNIIKNEVLYRIRVHPEALVGHIPARKLTELINEARNYSFEFLNWKKQFVLKKHWLAYAKKTCKRCNLPFIKQPTGHGKRRSFFCTNCQLQYL